MICRGTIGGSRSKRPAQSDGVQGREKMSRKDSDPKGIEQWHRDDARSQQSEVLFKSERQKYKDAMSKYYVGDTNNIFKKGTVIRILDENCRSNGWYFTEVNKFLACHGLPGLELTGDASLADQFTTIVGKKIEQLRKHFLIWQLTEYPEDTYPTDPQENDNRLKTFLNNFSIKYVWADNFPCLIHTYPFFTDANGEVILGKLAADQFKVIKETDSFKKMIDIVSMSKHNVSAIQKVLPAFFLNNPFIPGFHERDKYQSTILFREAEVDACCELLELYFNKQINFHALRHSGINHFSMPEYIGGIMNDSVITQPKEVHSTFFRPSIARDLLKALIPIGISEAAPAEKVDLHLKAHVRPTGDRILNLHTYKFRPYIVSSRFNQIIYYYSFESADVKFWERLHGEHFDQCKDSLGIYHQCDSSMRTLSQKVSLKGITAVFDISGDQTRLHSLYPICINRPHKKY